MSILQSFIGTRGLTLAPQSESPETKIDRAIRGGLESEQARLETALMVLDFYELRGIKHIPKRDAESQTDYRNRIKRTLPFTRRVVDILCSHLYSPGPNRTLQNDANADAFLQGVYRDNLVNVLMQRADRYATLQGIAAIQVGATGDERRPIKLQLWGEEQLALYPSEDDATKIEHVVTIDRHDHQTTYTWWSAQSIKTYRTKKLHLGQTTGGRVAELIGEEENPYGVLPFAFVHHDLPTNSHCVSGIGEYLATINNGLDIEASDMAQAVQAYHRPYGFAYDVAADWQPIVKYGNFIRINSNPTDLDRANPPRVEFLQADLDVQGGWDNIRQAIDTVLEGLGVPATMYRLSQASLPSGAALIAEQQPLIDYSRARQVPFERYETELAKVILQVGGAWYDPAYSAIADDIKLSITWPPATIRTPGQEQDQQDQTAVAMGLESTAMVVKRRFGLASDEEVWAHLERVAEDEEKLSGIKFTPPIPGMTDEQMQPEEADPEEAEAEGEMSDDESIDGTDA